MRILFGELGQAWRANPTMLQKMCDANCQGKPGRLAALGLSHVCSRATNREGCRSKTRPRERRAVVPAKNLSGSTRGRLCSTTPRAASTTCRPHSANFGLESIKSGSRDRGLEPTGRTAATRIGHRIGHRQNQPPARSCSASAKPRNASYVGPMAAGVSCDPLWSLPCPPGPPPLGEAPVKLPEGHSQCGRAERYQEARRCRSKPMLTPATLVACPNPFSSLNLSNAWVPPASVEHRRATHCRDGRLIRNTHTNTRLATVQTRVNANGIPRRGRLCPESSRASSGIRSKERARKGDRGVVILCSLK